MVKSRPASRQKKYLLLRALQKLSPPELTAVLPYLNASACSNIYECVYNVLVNKSVPEKTRKLLRRKLSTSQNDLRFLANPKSKRRERRVRLHKVGGAIIAPILAAAVPLLISLLSKK